MSQHKRLYIGFNDEGSALHAFIDYRDSDHLQEFDEQALNAKIAAHTDSAQTLQDYRCLQQKLNDWKALLH